MKFILRDLSSAITAKRSKTSRVDYFEGYDPPEGIVTANMGSIYLNLNGGSSATLWAKESGFNTNTGWVAVGSGGAGWTNQEIFVATAGQVDFTVTLFTFDANSKLSVYQNGIDLDEGGGFDWVRNVGLNKITLNTGATLNARIKVRIW